MPELPLPELGGDLYFILQHDYNYLIKIFQQYQLIEDEGLLITNGSTINIHNLTTSNISDGIILYENFNTHSFLTKEV